MEARAKIASGRRTVEDTLLLMQQRFSEAELAVGSVRKELQQLCAGLPGGHQEVRERVQASCQLYTEYTCSVCGSLRIG
jgi:hypothetical protein